MVFSPESIAAIERRWGVRPKGERPVIYGVATDSFFAPIRTRIEEWFAVLPTVAQERMRKNLLNPRSFLNTYHELAVGAGLVGQGLKAEYESSLDGLTPDWLVPSDARQPGLMVEVLTDNAPAETSSKARSLTDLDCRIMRIPLPFVVSVCLAAETPSNFRQRENKSTAARVESWLKEGPCAGSVLEVRGVKFTVQEKNNRLAHVQPVSTLVYCTMAGSLEDKMREKAEKYSYISAKYCLPLVVAAAAGVDLPLSEDRFSTVVSQIFSLQCGTVSAAIGLCGTSWDFYMRVIHNPQAGRPLRRDLLAGS